jgi:hypothetical protein
MSMTWIRRWRRLPARDRSLLREALLNLWVVRLALPVRALSALTRGAAEANRPVDVGRVAWAVKTAARAVPGAACLAQAVAAQRMLAARGKPSKLEVGVAKDPRGLQAHAWLICDGEILIGGEEAAQFVPLESP